MNARQQYREEVWTLMHGSGSSLQETAAVRVYLDESGGEDPNTPHAIVGGMMISYSRFHGFEDSWDEILERHSIEPPLHMKEFGRHGRFRNFTSKCRFELFSEISQLITKNKTYTISATLTNSEYQSTVAPEIRNKYSVYGMCFMLALMSCHKLATLHNYQHKIPFILDTGNPHKGHVAIAHAQAIELQREKFINVGGLHFEDDRDFGVLQAADVIAWGVRRQKSGLSFDHGFSPILDTLSWEKGHGNVPFEPQLLKTISDKVMARARAAENDVNEGTE